MGLAREKLDVSSVRSRIMKAVGQKDTGPEIVVRQILHSLGYRFRLHRRDLPGTPDIVLPKYRTVIFVHGCFWHRHEGCRKATVPKTRRAFWEEKFEANKIRDQNVIAALRELGWNVIVVWQCQTVNVSDLAALLVEALRTQEMRRIS